MRYIKKLGYYSQDYAVEVIDPPESCSKCNNAGCFNMIILDDSDVFFDTGGKCSANKAVIMVCIYCKQEVKKQAIVSIAEEWITREMLKQPNAKIFSEQILRQIIFIRGLISKIDTKGLFTEMEPTNELIFESFLPGKMKHPDIWIADDAQVAKTANLHPPLLIGNGCKIRSNSVCGPRTIIVDDSIVISGDKIINSIMADSIVTRKFD